MKYLGVARDTMETLTVTGALNAGSVAASSGSFAALNAADSMTTDELHSAIVTVSGSLKVGTSAVASEVQQVGRTILTLTPASVAASTAAEQTFNLSGLVVGDFVMVTPPGLTAGVAPVCARVSAPGVLAITFQNSTAGALVPAAGDYKLLTVR